MGDREDRLRARAYRQAATLYALWRRSGLTVAEQVAIFDQMEIEGDWINLVYALLDIGCSMGKILPERIPAYLDQVIREAMLNEGTGE